MNNDYFQYNSFSRVVLWAVFYLGGLIGLGGWMPATTGAAEIASTAVAPDVRFILQTQAGLTAYTTLTNTISLAQVQPMLTTITQENETYLWGDYKLAGRADTLKVIIGHEGWIIASFPPDRHAASLYDCATFNISVPSQMTNRPERAVIEIATALGISNPTVGFYDFRHPTAEGITQHWLFLANNGNRTSTINLPLENSYIERAYDFCTAYSNSKFFVNGEIVDQQGSVSQVIHRQGLLTADKLRAGQTNTMRIEALSLFGNGFVAGVSLVYTGTAELPITGGYQRHLPLIYPTILGDALLIQRSYLPVVTH